MRYANKPLAADIESESGEEIGGELKNNTNTVEKV